MAGVARARHPGRFFLLVNNMLVVLGFFVVFPPLSIRFVDQLGWTAIMVGIALGLRQLAQQGLGALIGCCLLAAGCWLLAWDFRLGLALGYAGGGWIFDTGRELAMPELPWLMLGCTGAITLPASWWQFQPRIAVPATLSDG